LQQTETKDEVAALQKESEMPIETLIDSLPKEILEKPASIHSESEDEDEDDKPGNVSDSVYGLVHLLMILCVILLTTNFIYFNKSSSRTVWIRK